MQKITKDNADSVDEGYIYLVDLKIIFADHEFNSRGRIDPLTVTQLAKTIERDGLIEPIVLQPWPRIPGKSFRIVSGYRRYTACIHLAAANPEKPDLGFIQATIKLNLTDFDARRLNFTENLHREDLNILQEAKGLVPYFNYYSVQEISNELKKPESWIRMRQNLLKLEPDIQVEIAAGLIKPAYINQLVSINDKEKRYEAVRKIKTSALAGEKKVVKIVKPAKDIHKAKRQGESDIADMRDHIYDVLGPGLHTRILAWVGGEITSYELYKDLSLEAAKIGKLYTMPVSEERKILV